MLPRIGLLCIAVAASTAVSAGARHAGCPQLRTARNVAIWSKGGQLFGDMDGDRRADRVTIRAARRAPASCGFLLVVETGTRTFAIRVPEGYKDQDLPISNWFLDEPFVALIVRLAADRSQVVVARWHGASIAVVSLYGVVGGKLTLLRFPPPFTKTLDLFGSVGTGTTAARCRPGGPLILTYESPADQRGRRVRFGQVQYRLTGSRFRRTTTRSVVVPRSQSARVAKNWGAWSGPFEGCVVARGARL